MTGAASPAEAPPDSPPDLPLAGIRVVELGGSVAVPYACWVLASLGAEVVKVERPDGGDDARAWMPPERRPGFGGIFTALNAGKRSVAVDFKDPAQMARLTTLIGRADVVVQNLRPGLAERLGIGAEAMTAANPRLIYCDSGAFGRTGPLADRPGYDPLMQAFGGIMSVTGHEGDDPVRVGTSLIDMGTGMWAVIGVLAALRRRDATGEGGRVDVSLYETALGWMTYHVSNFLASGRDPRRPGSRSPGMAVYQAFACADGHLIIAAPSDRLFAKVAGVLGHPEWPGDERFATNEKRFANLDVLVGLIEGVTRTQPRAHWQAALDAAGVPSAPLQSVSEVVAHPQTRALGILETTPDGWELVGLPLSFDGMRPAQRSGPPVLGEATDAVLGRS
ncbi:CoA transferase [Thalassobaculum fulvum]|uniref:CoA transferase n=1 Tax=Thalassobaculum fulvum TaxID=1633335 RepID=A0A918XWU6_9PROT|nr:CoA transferase [Thalassobaculum fulvum]GHD60312.1 CoA transferase [Thalassobaculum fulvum]